MRRPDFFIVGAPKCGTTAMNYYLGQHPEIFVPRMKEIHYFGSDLYVNRDMSLESYLSIFEEATDEKRVGETSVLYLSSKLAPQEIKQFNPEAQIIVMLRNPVEKLYSDHSYAIYREREDVADVEAALHAEEERRKAVHGPRKPRYRETLKYTEQLQRYVDVFGWESIHVIIYDDFAADTLGTYQRALEFLGVAWDFEPDLQIVNSNRRARSKSLRRLLSNPPQSVRGLVRSIIPSTLRHKVIGRLEHFNSRYQTRSPMDPEVRKRLQKEFEPEVEQLGELLGRDLTHWSRN